MPRLSYQPAGRIDEASGSAQLLGVPQLSVVRVPPMGVHARANEYGAAVNPEALVTLVEPGLIRISTGTTELARVPSVPPSMVPAPP